MSLYYYLINIVTKLKLRILNLFSVEESLQNYIVPL